MVNDTRMAGASRKAAPGDPEAQQTEGDDAARTRAWVEQELQLLYSRCLADHGIETGDIDPLTVQSLEEAEEKLSRALHHWMVMAQPAD